MSSIRVSAPICLRISGIQHRIPMRASSISSISSMPHTYFNTKSTRWNAAMHSSCTCLPTFFSSYVRSFSSETMIHPSTSSSAYIPAFPQASTSIHSSQSSTPSSSASSSSSSSASSTPTSATVGSTSTSSGSSSSSSPSARRPLRASRAAVSLTSAASSRLHELLSLRSSSSSSPVLGIRLGIKRKGCNGLAYTLNYVTSDNLSSTKGDEIIETNGFKLFIDSRAVFYLVGTIMDYVDDDLRAEFVFQNPKEKGKCGCGESFTVD